MGLFEVEGFHRESRVRTCRLRFETDGSEHASRLRLDAHEPFARRQIAFIAEATEAFLASALDGETDARGFLPAFFGIIKQPAVIKRRLDSGGKEDGSEAKYFFARALMHELIGAAPEIEGRRRFDAG